MIEFIEAICFDAAPSECVPGGAGHGLLFFSHEEKEHIAEGLKSGLRNDGGHSANPLHGARQ